MQQNQLYKGLSIILGLSSIIAIIAAAFFYFNTRNISPDDTTAAETSKIAVETVHLSQNGGARNVNSASLGARKYYIPFVNHQFVTKFTQTGDLTFYHNITIQNVSSNTNSVTVKYFQNSASPIVTKTISISPNGFANIGPDAGLPAQYAGSVTIESSELSVVEVALENTLGQTRGILAIPDSAKSKKLYIPIAYDSAFAEYDSFVSIQNPATVTIPKGAVQLKMRCKDSTGSFTLTNATDILPSNSEFIKITTPANYSCNAETFPVSKLFGHGVIESDYDLVADLIVSRSTTGIARWETLDGRLSTKLFVPSILFGNLNGRVANSSLNISNPNSSPANVFVSVYVKDGLNYSKIESRRPQAPGPNSVSNDLNTPIPAEGEKSFFYKRNLSYQGTDLNQVLSFGQNDEAWGFSIVDSDLAISASQNKSITSDDFAEKALTAEEISDNAFIPQFFLDFAPGGIAYNSRTSVLNTDPTKTGFYDISIFNSDGSLVIPKKQIFIDPLQPFVMDRSYMYSIGLTGNKAYSIQITPSRSTVTSTPTATSTATVPPTLTPTSTTVPTSTTNPTTTVRPTTTTRPTVSSQPSCIRKPIGDANCDNALNLLDLDIIKAEYGTNSTRADFNGDGKVNFDDYDIWRINVELI